MLTKLNGANCIKRYCGLLCLVLMFLWSMPIGAFAANTTVDLESQPYDSETLLVKLAVPQIGTMSTMGATTESIVDYGDLEFLLDVKAAPTNGARRARAQQASWYVLHLNEGETVEAVKEKLEQDSSVLAVTFNYNLTVLDGESDSDYEKSDETKQRIINNSENNETNDNIDEITTNEQSDSLVTQSTANQWHLSAAGLPAAKSYLASNGFDSGGSSDVIVAVLDTGVDYNHPDLKDSILRDADGNVIGGDTRKSKDENYDYSGDYSGDPKPDTAREDYMHGTHCAGIIAATGAVAAEGVAKDVKILPVKMLDSSGGGMADMIKGIIFAKQQGAKVVSMSIGLAVAGMYAAEADEVYAPILDTIRKYDDEMIFVAAAGNASKTMENDSYGWPNEPVAGVSNYCLTYPAVYPEVIGVMSYDQNPTTDGDQKSNFSRWDPTPGNEREFEIAAPGSNIFSTVPGNAYASWSGTSMATPYVAGCAALLLTKYQNRDDFTIQDVKDILLQNTDSMQAITIGGTVYKMPALRIDKALEFKRTAVVSAPYYQYYLTNGSGRAPHIAAESSGGTKFKYSYRNDSYSGSSAPRDVGVYEATAALDNIYYQGETTAMYTVVKKQGDLNADDSINRDDFEIFRRHYGGVESSTERSTAKSNQRYNSFLDYNSDGKINSKDLLVQYIRMKNDK